MDELIMLFLCVCFYLPPPLNISDSHCLINLDLNKARANHSGFYYFVLYFLLLGVVYLKHLQLYHTQASAAAPAVALDMISTAAPLTLF